MMNSYKKSLIFICGFGLGLLAACGIMEGKTSGFLPAQEISAPGGVRCFAIMDGETAVGGSCLK